MSATNLQVDPHVERRYKIVRYIGGGAYGVVWKAIDRRSRKLVALKKVFDAFTNDTDAQRTYREAMLLLNLHHVNVVKLLNIVRSLDDVDLYMVFELQESDVHAVIKANILQNTQRQYIAYQLVRCVHYLHCKGVIHRDLKPANVLVNSDCTIKLADFGLARCYSLASVAGGGMGMGMLSMNADDFNFGGASSTTIPFPSLTTPSAVDSGGCGADGGGGGGIHNNEYTSTNHNNTNNNNNFFPLANASATVPPSSSAGVGVHGKVATGAAGVAGGGAEEAKHFNMTVMNSRILRGAAVGDGPQSEAIGTSADGRGGLLSASGGGGGGGEGNDGIPSAVDSSSFVNSGSPSGGGGLHTPPTSTNNYAMHSVFQQQQQNGAAMDDDMYTTNTNNPNAPRAINGANSNPFFIDSTTAADSLPPLTDYIATRWYRAPELLCGTSRYTTAIDMWAIGCIIAELFLGGPLFKGSSTDDQLQLIVCALGPPTASDIESWKVSTATDAVAKLHQKPLAESGPYATLYAQLASLPRDAAELVKLLLPLDPSQRLTSLQTLQHPYIAVFATPEELFGEEDCCSPTAIDMATPVVIELDDGVKHSVQEYRTALYEQAASLKTGGE